MHRTIIVGSPRAEGRSAHLAQQIFDACIEDCPDDGVSLVSVASLAISGCVGCDACKRVLADGADRLPAACEPGDPLEPVASIARSDARRHVCVIVDDMPEVRKHLDAADEVIVVCPVYFASAPAQMKALMDRMQPYFWSDVRQGNEKRPMILHLVGEGGDPHGVDPLIGTVRSAFAVAGFALEEVLDWRGCIDGEGNIQEDAEVYGG